MEQDVVRVKYGIPPDNRSEYLMKNKDVTLPTVDVPPGSFAYTADLSYLAQFDGEEWVEIGGDE